MKKLLTILHLLVVFAVSAQNGGMVIDNLTKKDNINFADLVMEAGKMLEGTPYVAHTLEADKEQPVINLRELDCTAFAENCLALAHAANSNPPSFEMFADEPKKIRYFNDEIKDYSSRIQHLSDWNYENDKKGIIKDISEKILEDYLQNSKKATGIMVARPQ